MLLEGTPPNIVNSLVKCTQSQVLRVRDRLINELSTEDPTLSFQELGERFSLTRERVRQIIESEGGKSGSDLRAEREALSAKAKKREYERIRADVRAHPGSTVEEVLERTGVKKSVLGRALTSWEKKLVINWGASSIEPHWPEEKILQVLQRAATYAYPLTGNAYDELNAVGEIEGPTRATITKRFDGSWAKACTAAGVECGETHIETYNRNWTENDLYRYVMNYLLDKETIGNLADFESYLKKIDGAPSIPSIRNYLGSWTQMKAEALVRLINNEEIIPELSGDFADD